MLRRGLFLLLPLFLAGCGYNTIQTYDEAAAKAKQDIEVQLQRRSDLVPEPGGRRSRDSRSRSRTSS